MAVLNHQDSRPFHSATLPAIYRQTRGGFDLNTLQRDSRALRRLSYRRDSQGYSEVRSFQYPVARAHYPASLLILEMMKRIRHDRTTLETKFRAFYHRLLLSTPRRHDSL